MYRDSLLLTYKTPQLCFLEHKLSSFQVSLAFEPSDRLRRTLSSRTLSTTSHTTLRLHYVSDVYIVCFITTGSRRPHREARDRLGLQRPRNTRADLFTSQHHSAGTQQPCLPAKTGLQSAYDPSNPCHLCEAGALQVSTADFSTQLDCCRLSKLTRAVVTQATQLSAVYCGGSRRPESMTVQATTDGDLAVYLTPSQTCFSKKTLDFFYEDHQFATVAFKNKSQTTFREAFETLQEEQASGAFLPRHKLLGEGRICVEHR